MVVGIRNPGLKTTIVSLCATVFLVLTGCPFVGSVAAEPSLVFSDNFDDEPYDLSDWTLDFSPWNGDLIELTSENSSSYPYSLKMHIEGGIAEHVRANSSLVPLDYAEDYVLSLDFYMAYPCGRGEVIANDGRIFVMQVAGFLQIGEDLYLGAFDWDEWNHLVVEVTPSLGTYDVYVDNELIAESVPFRADPFGFLQVGTDDYYLSGTWNAGTWYIDNIEYTGTSIWMQFPENFDDGDISDWSVLTAGNSEVEVSSASSHSSPYSLHVKYGGEIARAESEPVAEFDSDHTIYFWFNPVMTKNLVVIDTGIIEIIQKLGLLYCVDSKGRLKKTDCLLMPGWHNIVIEYKNPRLDLWVDGDHIGSFLAKNQPDSMTINVGSSMDPGRRDAGEAYWDDFVVLPS